MKQIKAPWNNLPDLLQHYPSTAEEVEAVIRIIRELYPAIPTPKIIYPGGGWHLDKPVYVHKSHLIQEAENFETALANVATKRMTVDSSEERIFLRHLLEHPFGWSATIPSHHNDAWVHYLRHVFTLPDLTPVLDDMTWEEEVKLLPYGYGIGGPRYLLFIDSAGYYFYAFEMDELWRARKSLEEVYLGIRERRWWVGSENPWERVQDNGEDYEHYDYFPVWRGGVEENGTNNFRLAYSLRDFTPLSIDSA